MFWLLSSSVYSKALTFLCPMLWQWTGAQEGSMGRTESHKTWKGLWDWVQPMNHVLSWTPPGIVTPPHGQPIPIVCYPFHEKNPPDVQPIPPLAQLEAISSHFVTGCLGEEADPQLATTFQGVVVHEYISDPYSCKSCTVQYSNKTIQSYRINPYLSL